MSMGENKPSIGDPTGLILITVSMVAFMLHNINVGRVPPEGGALYIAWLGAIGLSLGVACVICFVRGDWLQGTMAGFFGILIAIGGALSLVVKAWLPGVALESEGYYWLWIGILLLPFVLVFLRINWLMSFTLLVGSAFCWLLAFSLIGIGSPGWIRIAGWLNLWWAVYFLYEGVAFMVNGIWGKGVIPVPGPLLK